MKKKETVESEEEKYPGVFKRLLSWLISWFPILVSLWIIIFEDNIEIKNIVFNIIILINILINVFLYYKKGQNIGQVLFRIKVVTFSDRTMATPAMLMWRWIILTVIILLFGFFIINGLFIIFEERKRGIHDDLSGTIVVYCK